MKLYAASLPGSGPVAPQVCAPSVDEFVHTLTAEFQKAGNAVRTAYRVGPFEPFESPVGVVARFDGQGRRRDAAYLAVKLQRPSLDQASQRRREIRGPQESARRIGRVRRASEQPV